MLELERMQLVLNDCYQLSKITWKVINFRLLFYLQSSIDDLFIIFRGYMSYILSFSEHNLGF